MGETIEMSQYTFDIDGIRFTSKKSVIDHVKNNIHSKYIDYQDISNEHLQFMICLLRHHPWSDQKIGIGVKRMWIQQNENYPTRGFWLERHDGTKTDFSFYQCVSSPSQLRDFKSACRKAIADIVIRFKTEFFSRNRYPICPILGTFLTSKTSHVDHAPPNTFDKIVLDFIASRNIDVEKAPLLEHMDGKIGNCFNNDTFTNDWITFHNEMAELRVISSEANLSVVKLRECQSK